MYHSGSRVMQGQFLSRVKNQAHESNDLKLKLFSKQSDSMSKLPRVVAQTKKALTILSVAHVAVFANDS
jgi:hypothetical protein